MYNLGMTSEETTQQTRTAWNLFDKFSDAELDTLLRLAGVIPGDNRSLKLHQTLLVWFPDFVPNLEEIFVILREKNA